ncbi:MAG: restriction endonuclease subunit S [Actinomycetota bacterium]|nr:restriction endonuclease subunit S [Actinomycetota bacterium]
MRMRLRHLLRERDTRGHVDEEVLSIYRDLGVVPKDSRTDNFNKTPEDLSRYKLVLPGDVVVNKMKAWQGSVAVSSHRGIVSGDYLVCEVDHSVVRRFLHHLLRSRPLIAEYEVRSTGIRPSQWRLYWDGLADIAIDLPSEPEQRSIAEFLDAETTRIDGLITKKTQMIALATARFESWRERILLANEDVVWTPLHYLTDPRRPIVYGIVQAGEEVPHGVPYIKTGDVANLRPDRLSRTSPAIDEAYRRARVRPGDIVIAMRASIGLPVVIPPELPAANLTQGTARVAPHDEVDLVWLFHALQCRAVQEQCRVRAVGTTFKTLNIWDLRRIRIPTPSTAAQRAIGDQIQRGAEHLGGLVRRLALQVDLLTEHRQAMITTIVSGELKVA